MGIKACDLTCWPGCGPQGIDCGCHHAIGTAGRYPREQRRRLEAQAAAHTRLQLIDQSAHDPALRRLLLELKVIDA